MKKKFLTFIFIISSLYAYNYSLSEGWQMVGVMGKIEDMSIFDNSCVKDIWRYDNENLIWKNYNPTNKDNSTLTYLDEAKGFWVKTDSSCQINPPSDLSFFELNNNKVFIIGDYNQSKRFEIIYDSDRFNELYSNYVDSEYIPDVNFDNNFVLFFRNSSQKYTNIIRVKEIKGYQLYSEIVTQTLITKGKSKVRDNISAYFEFVSIPKLGTTIFNESITIENYDEYGDLINNDINNTFVELPFEEIDLKKAEITYGEVADMDGKRLEVIQNLEVFGYLYKNFINPIGVDVDSPSIDFEKNTLLALFMGRYGSGGYDIKVKWIKEYEDYVEVDIENTLVGYGCPASSSLTSPAIFVTIPKTDKEVIFKEYASFTNCE